MSIRTKLDSPLRILVHLTPDELVTLGNVLLTTLTRKTEIPGATRADIAAVAEHIRRKIEQIPNFLES